MLPQDSLPGVEQRHSLAGRAADPFGEPCRAHVRRRDQRDQALGPVLGVRPLASRAHRFRRIAVAPVLADERPPELRPRVLGALGVRRLRPRAGVPDQETAPTKPAPVITTQDGKRAAAVLSPTLEPHLHDPGAVLALRVTPPMNSIATGSQW